MLTNRYTVVGLLVLLAALVVSPFAAHAQDLSQSFTTSDGSLTFQYPAGWVLEEFFGTIILANSQQAADVFFEGNPITEGQALLAVLTPTAVSEELSVSGDTADSAEALLAVFLRDTSGTTGAIETLTLGDKPVARGSATSEDDQLVVYAVDFGAGGLGLVAQISLPGEADRHQDTTHAIIESMRAQALVAPVESGDVVWQQLREVPTDAVPGDGYNSADAVVVGPDDTIYVLDGFVGVHVFDADGTEQGLIVPEDMFGILSALAVDTAGNLWTVDFTGTLVQFDASGAVLSSVELGDTVELAFFGVELAIGPEDNLYLLNPHDIDEQAVGEILVYSPGGELLNRFAVGSDEYFYEASIAFGPDGNLYVAEHFGEDGIKVFDPQGNLLREGIGTGRLYNMNGIAVGPDGSIYTAISDSPIYHFANDGTLLARFGQSQFMTDDLDFEAETLPAMQAGVFYNIGGMALLSSGDLVVADANPSWWQLVRINFSE